MTAILVAMLNFFIKEKYYPQRWLNLVEISLKKGKGPVLEKLRCITLIETYIQIRMWITLGSKKEELIEKDTRFSIVNYSSRQNYSIESVILEVNL